MQMCQSSHASRFRRAVALALFAWVALGVFAPALAVAQANGPSATADAQAAAPVEEESFFMQVLKNLLNSRGLMETLGKPQYTIAAFIALNVIVFVETGLLVGFFLPGDSLLVTAGLICANETCGWNPVLLLATLSISAIVGDSMGYSIGYKAGPKIFCREKSWFFNKDHLLKAREFYERHGGKTIIIARFMPILRTFAPVVAGVGKMEYKRFLFFNIFGGIGWVCSMVLLGYYLPTVINPILQPVFGAHFEVQQHIEKVVVIVVLLSISPAIFVWLRSKLRGTPPPQPLVAAQHLEVQRAE